MICLIVLEHNMLTSLCHRSMCMIAAEFISQCMPVHTYEHLLIGMRQKRYKIDKLLQVTHQPAVLWSLAQAHTGR